MFLFDVIINDTGFRLSMEGIALTHWWDNQVMSFDPPIYDTSKKSGGHCSMKFGSISFSPDLFESDWPPPVSCVTTVYYTETTEEARQSLFEATLHISDIEKDEITYDFYAETIDKDLLDEDYEYDEDTADIVKSGTYKWTASAHGTFEYYCELDAGGDPSLVEPTLVLALNPYDDSLIEYAEGTLGSLTSAHWAYGDNDTLGYNTIYIRLVGGADPDTYSDGQLTARYTDRKFHLSRAFGTVVHEEPVRLPNALNGYYKYERLYIKGRQSSGTTTATTADKLVNSAARFDWIGITIGDRVRNTTDDTETTVTAIDSATTLSLAADIFTDAENYSVGNCGEGDSDVWCVYDDGVDISENVTQAFNYVSDGTYHLHDNIMFELTSAPVGVVTIGGTAAYTTAKGVFDYAIDRVGSDAQYSGLWLWGEIPAAMTLDSTKAKSPSPSVNYCASDQMPLVDFLDKVAAFYTHIFYFSNNVLYLIDMDEDNGSSAFDNFDFFDLSLEYPEPISQIKAEWTTRESGEWSEADNPGVASGVYIKEIDDTLIVPGSYKYGDEIVIKDPFVSDKATIEIELTDMLTMEEKPDVTAIIPFEGTMPVPGQKFTFSDTTMKVSSTVTMHARDIHYDIENNEIKLIGEGSIGAT